MLNSAPVRNGKASYDGPETPDTWQPLEFPQIDPQSLEARNAFYRRRSVRTVRLAGGALTITPVWQKKLPELVRPWTVKIQFDQQPVELVLSESIVALLLKELDASIEIEALKPEHRALMLEHALSDALAAIEAALGCSLSIQSAQKTDDLSSSSHPNTFILRIELDGALASWCLLRTDHASVLRLAQGLDRVSSAPSDMLDLPVPAHVRWAAVDLSLSELKSLMPGDIVLVDYNCSEHETAMAVIGDYLVAPVKIVPDGYQLLKPPKTLKDSEAAWCSANLPVQNGLLEGAAPGDIPLRMFVEFAQLNLSYAKMRELKAGTVIGSGQPFNNRVDLVVGGVCVGRGEPTTIGSGLGVRILSK